MKQIIALLSVCLISLHCSKEEVSENVKFLGAYTMAETCGLSDDTYDLVIWESGRDAQSIIIYNLYNWGEIASATVSGNTLTIEEQILDGISFSGTGTLNGDALEINFDVSLGTESDSCNATGVRK